MEDEKWLKMTPRFLVWIAGLIATRREKSGRKCALNRECSQVWNTLTMYPIIGGLCDSGFWELRRRWILGEEGYIWELLVSRWWLKMRVNRIDQRDVEKDENIASQLLWHSICDVPWMGLIYIYIYTNMLIHLTLGLLLGVLESRSRAGAIRISGPETLNHKHLSLPLSICCKNVIIF